MTERISLTLRIPIFLCGLCQQRQGHRCNEYTGARVVSLNGRGILLFLLLFRLLAFLFASELTLLYCATTFFPLPASFVVELALFVDARHREHAKLAVVQQLTITVVIATSH